MRNKGLILIMVVSFLNLFSIVEADLWKKHINSDLADQILCNGSEVWVRPDNGGLVRWDIASGEYTRFYDNRGLPSSDTKDMVYDDMGRLVCVCGKNILRYEDGSFTQLCERPQPAYQQAFTFADGHILMGYGGNVYYGLYYWNGTDWVIMEEFSDYEIFGLAGDPEGGFWASVRKLDEESNEYTASIIHYKDGDMIFYTDIEVIGEDSGGLISMQMVVDSTGIPWVCLHAGVAWFDGVKWQRHNWVDEIDDGLYEVENVARDNDGVIWIAPGYNGGDLRCYDGENWTIQSEYKGEKVLWVTNNQMEVFG